MRGWLREVGALGLATSTLFAVHDTSDRGGARPMVMVNPGICTSLGYQPRELLGQQLCQVFYGTGGVAGSEQALQTLQTRHTTCSRKQTHHCVPFALPSCAFGSSPLALIHNMLTRYVSVHLMAHY